MSYKPRATRPVIDRLMEKVEESSDGCWLYTGSLSASGYGAISLGRRGEGRTMVHRYTYEFFRAEIPDGLFLDHLCRRPACVNPWHLEPVTNRENVLRGLVPLVNGEHNRRKTQCAKGHPYDTENTAWSPDGRRRYCRACHRVAALARYHAKKKEVAA